MFYSLMRAHSDASAVVPHLNDDSQKAKGKTHRSKGVEESSIK